MRSFKRIMLYCQSHIDKGSVKSLWRIFIFTVGSVFFANNGYALNQSDLVILPPDYNYKKICKAPAQLHTDIKVETLRKQPFQTIRLKDLVQMLKLYHRGSGAIATDYDFAKQIIAYIETLPRTNDNDYYINEALFVKFDMMRKGKGYAQNTNDARSVLDKLISLNSIKAYSRYGNLMVNENRYDDAVSYYKKAIVLGEDSAWYSLAKIYYDKNVDVTEAETQAAIINAQNATLRYIAQGNCQSLYSLGSMYEYMKGLPNAEDYSVKWYEKAAQIDDKRAKLKFAELLKKGYGDTDASESRIISLWKDAATLGSEQAMYLLGGHYLLAESDAGAGLPWLEQAAEYHHLGAMELLAQIYNGGLDNIPADADKRLMWLKRASEHESSSLDTLEDYIAMLELREDTSPETLFTLYEKAANMGSDQALIKIGDMLRYGIGREAEPTRALRYYRLAASIGGKTLAMRKLILGYQCQIGTHYNVDKINAWRQQIAYFSEEDDLGAAYNAIRTGDKIDEAISSLQFLITTRKSAQAMVALGAYYQQKGENEAAEKWFAQALDSDKDENEMYKAHFHLGQLYATGDIVSPDRKKGIKLMTIAAQSGNDSAYNALGDIYKQSGEYDKAIKAYRKAAKYGKGSAFKQLYKIYREQGKPLDAVRALEKAAASHEVNAMLELAKGYDSNDWIVSRDNSQASYWFNQAVNAYPCETEDIADIADSYLNGKNGASKNLEEGKMWLGFLRNDNNASDEDQFHMANMILKSDLAKDDDYKQRAMTTLRDLANKGNMDALNIVSEMELAQYNSRSNSEDIARTISYLERNAQQGNVNAMMNLANLYVSGYIVEVDYAKARNWLEKAATSGNKEAAKRLRVLQ